MINEINQFEIQPISKVMAYYIITASIRDGTVNTTTKKENTLIK